MKCLFCGCGVALATPFLNGKVDYCSLKNLIVHCLNGGAQAIVVLATTGEGATITISERTKIIMLARKLIDAFNSKNAKNCKNIAKNNDFLLKNTKKHHFLPNRVKLIVGTGSNNFTTCLKLTEQAKNLGADGVLVVTPFYNKTTQNGIIKYYAELARLQIPMLIYNVPARTGLNIELNTLKKIILQNKMVYGIKESTTDITRIIALHEICRDKIAVYSGEDNLNFLFYCLGASGAISVAANAFPLKVAKLFDLTIANKIPQAQQLNSNLSELNSALFLETNPIPIKYFGVSNKVCWCDLRYTASPPCEYFCSYANKMYSQHCQLTPS